MIKEKIKQFVEAAPEWLIMAMVITMVLAGLMGVASISHKLIDLDVPAHGTVSLPEGYEIQTGGVAVGMVDIPSKIIHMPDDPHARGAATLAHEIGHVRSPAILTVLRTFSPFAGVLLLLSMFSPGIVGRRRWTDAAMLTSWMFATMLPITELAATLYGIPVARELGVPMLRYALVTGLGLSTYVILTVPVLVLSWHTYKYFSNPRIIVTAEENQGK